MTQQLCEICKSSDAVAKNTNVMGTFYICEKCNGVINFVLENEHLDEELIPQNVRNELPTYCGGWDTIKHIVEEPLIFLITDKEDAVVVSNIMYFCRSCLLEYMNDETVQKI